MDKVKDTFMMGRMTSCWILTEKGLKGTENQCIALAQAVGLDYTLKQIRLKNPWKFFTPLVRHFSLNALTADSDVLAGPWPELLIASGRKAIAPALWIKQQSGNRTKLVIIQNPKIKDDLFDLVIVPKHDNYHGPNVLRITGALSLVTPETLAAAKQEFAQSIQYLPSPRIAVLIGGTSRTHKITANVMRFLTMQLNKLQQQGFSLMVTASRRTPQPIQQQLNDALATALQNNQAQFYDGTGPNPYQGYLAWADAILVTEDSVSMACEAISTGKPVYIIRMEGGSKRFQRFHDNLVQQGFAKWFTGQINGWDYTPPEDLKLAADATRQLMA